MLTTAAFGTGIIPLPNDGHAYAASSIESTIETTISTGMDYLGTPYQFGSNRNNTDTFDCSDFTKHIFKVGAGVTLPASSATQADYIKKKGSINTDWSSLQRGDLMFFMSYRGTSESSYSGINKSNAKVTHVGVYLGDGKMLHTYSNASGGVRVDNIDNKHWEYRFLFGGSVL
ncbi:Peptidoglycan DL-endopeptidase CwlO precursor [compost metagenome]